MLPVFRVKTSGWFNSETSAFRVNLFQLLYSTVGRLEEFKVETYPIEQNWTKNQSNFNRLIGFGNWTKSNTYFAVSSIFEPIELIYSNKIELIQCNCLLTPQTE